MCLGLSVPNWACDRGPVVCSYKQCSPSLCAGVWQLNVCHCWLCRHWLSIVLLIYQFCILVGHIICTQCIDACNCYTCHTSVCLCLWSTYVSCAKMAEWSNQLFGEHMWAQGTLYKMRSITHGDTWEGNMTVYCNVPPYDCLHSSSTRHCKFITASPVRSVVLTVICVALYIRFVTLIVCLEAQQTAFSLIYVIYHMSNLFHFRSSFRAVIV